jgi:hypothetical protein
LCVTWIDCYISIIYHYNQDIHTLSCLDIVSFISIIFPKHYTLCKRSITEQMKIKVFYVYQSRSFMWLLSWVCLQHMLVKLCWSDPLRCVHKYKHIYGRQQLYSVTLVLKSVYYSQAIHTLTCPEIINFISLIFHKHYLLEREAILCKWKPRSSCIHHSSSFMWP